MYHSSILIDDWLAEPPKSQPQMNVECLSQNETDYLNKCFKYMMVLGIVHTKSEFCTQILKRSPDYLSMIQSSGRKPSVRALHQLLLSMGEKADEYEMSSTHQTQFHNLQKLIQEGQNFVSKRLLKDYY